MFSSSERILASYKSLTDQGKTKYETTHFFYQIVRLYIMLKLKRSLAFTLMLQSVKRLKYQSV